MTNVPIAALHRLTRETLEELAQRPGYDLSTDGKKSLIAQRIWDKHAGYMWRTLGLEHAKTIADADGCDVSDTDSHEELVRKIMRKYGSVDAPNAPAASAVKTNANAAVTSFVEAFNDSPNALASAKVALAPTVNLWENSTLLTNGANNVLQYFIKEQQIHKLNRQGLEVHHKEDSVMIKLLVRKTPGGNQFLQRTPATAEDEFVFQVKPSQGEGSFEAKIWCIHSIQIIPRSFVAVDHDVIMTPAATEILDLPQAPPTWKKRKLQ